MRRNETSDSARARGKAKAEETRALRAALNAQPLSELRATAKEEGIKGYSTKTKAELVALLVRRHQGKGPKREKVTLTEAKKRLAAGRTRTLKGRGPFRLVIVKDGNVYADLGPYAAARGAQTDAKTLLRRVVGDTHSLLNRSAQEAIDAGEVEASAFGPGTRVVDGWVAALKQEAEALGAEEIDAQAWVIGHPTAAQARKKIKGAKAAHEAAFAPASVPAALRNNGRASVADDAAARELVLYAENNGRLYTQMVQPIMHNLARKLAAGRFDRDLAVKGMGHLADAAAKAYTKEMGGGSGFGAFSAATRRRAAADLLDGYMEEIEGIAAGMGGGKGRRNPPIPGSKKQYAVLRDQQDGTYTYVRGDGAAYFGLPRGDMSDQEVRGWAAARGLRPYRYGLQGEKPDLASRVRASRALGREKKAAKEAAKAAARAMRGARSNPIVAFQTKDGPVSFRTKKKK